MISTLKYTICPRNTNAMKLKTTSDISDDQGLLVRRGNLSPLSNARGEISLRENGSEITIKKWQKRRTFNIIFSSFLEQERL